MTEEAIKQNQTQKILINKFMVPESAYVEFMQVLRVNRAFIKTLPGFVRDFVLEKSGGPGEYNYYIT